MRILNMDKIYRLTFAAIILLGFLSSPGCDNKDDTGVASLKKTKWILKQSFDPETQSTTEFPPGIRSFYIIFNNDGSLTIENLCNFSYGTYSVMDSSLNITGIGPATKLYCISETFMQWESALINGLKTAKVYSIDEHTLYLTCDNNFKLIFKSEEKVR